MADFPGGVYSPRTKENKSGVVYDEDKKTIGYAEDITKLDAEVIALETFLSPKKLTVRPEINLNEIKKQAVPDQVQVGLFWGYSLPVYAGDHEELYFTHKVPERWDGASNIRVKIHACLAGAEDVGDKFQLRLAWENTKHEEVTPVTSNDVDVETTILTDRNAQYDEYHEIYTVDYDIDGEGNEIAPGDILGCRLRRIAASALEVTNEIIILGIDIEYQRDKFGGAF